jgi:DNA gyrase subunit A
LAVAVENIDKVIELIRSAKDSEEARAQLMAKPWSAKDITPLIDLIDDPEYRVIDGAYQLSELQARAILDLRLHRLTGLERNKIGEDLRELCDKISEYLEILASKELLFNILRDELEEMREQFANERRTTIEEGFFEQDIEDLIQQEDMVVTVSDAG